MKIERLRCEFLVDPVGLGELAPRLSWELASRRPGARQVAYRIRCASTPAGLRGGRGALWDSGRVESDLTAHVGYGGTTLRSRDRCFWCVWVWDETGARRRSPPARWTMGLLTPDDWTARWIASDAPPAGPREPGIPDYFRRDFQATGRPARATAYVTARGVVELRLNGAKVGDEALTPEWTEYEHRLQYRAFDVTGLITEGANVVAAIVGDGWWSGFVGWQERRGSYGSLEKSLLVQLELEWPDGRREVVGTDGRWGCGRGGILTADLQMGETFDARLEPDGWDRADFAGPPWAPARVVPPPPVPLVAFRSEPIRVTERLTPVSVRQSAPGCWIFDLGQNFAGWVRLRVQAPAGTRLQLRHAERLNPDGTLYTENLRRARATDVYVCRGGGTEEWEPRFTFHGFQYVELTGLPGSARADMVTGCVAHSDMMAAGEFHCSHPGVNRLWRNSVWSLRGNFLSVPTDCPQRDERLGWMGDAQVFLRTATCHYDVAAFFAKWMADVEDSQSPEGVFPDVAPRLREDRAGYVGLDGLAGAAGWADAGVIVPWTLWQVYEDRRVIERHWGAMVRWLDYLERTNPGGLRTRELGNNYGDWLCLPSDTRFRVDSPMKQLMATAFWADDAAKLSAMARAIGRGAEAERFAAMAARVRGAFCDAFLGSDGALNVATQTADLLALTMNLAPEHARATLLGRLLADLESRGWHLSTGFIGVGRLNPALTEAGRGDVAYRLLFQDDFPSWLYPVRHGATTIWERWNGWTEKEGFFDPSMNSFNHYTLGSVSEWLYRHVAGIDLDPEYPGFRRFILRPWPDARLRSASARYHSLHGEIRSAWRISQGLLRWRVTLPPNTRARVGIPGPDGSASWTEAAAGTHEFTAPWG